MTVGLRSSSFWQGEHACESCASLGFELRAKEVRPYNWAHRSIPPQRAMGGVIDLAPTQPGQGRTYPRDHVTPSLPSFTMT
jgi:hypothetical protein